MDYYLGKLRASIQQLSRSRIFFGIELILSGLFGLCIVFPILAVLMGLNELLRLGQKIGLWLVYGDGFEISPDEIGSNYSLVMENEKKHTILYLGELEGTLDLKTVRDNFQKHVIENKAYSRLTKIWQKKWFYMCLKKCDNFDIANHIRAYPGTENRVVREKELMGKILPELSQDITDLDKPQWELVIIPYYQEINSDDPEEDTQFTPTKSLKIIRVHHSYMDGASTLIMIADTFSGEGNSFPFVIDPCKPLKISRASMLLYKLTSLALFSSSMIQNMVQPPYTRQSRFSLRKSQKPGKVLFARTSKIPMSSFQGIKDKSGVSMPAIVSAVLSRAVRSLETRFPDNRNQTGKHQQPLWIVAGMFPYNSNKPCNQHVGIETFIDTSDVSGCELLSLMNDELGRLAKNPLVNVYYWESLIIGRSPAIVSKFILNLAVAPLLLSNIPLCTRSIKMWGKDCTGITGWVPLLCNTGLGIVSVRYDDHFRYCLQADSSVISQEELDCLVSQLEHQVNALQQETSLLKRRISADVSLFSHEKDKSLSSSSKLTVAKEDDVEDENSNNNVTKASDSSGSPSDKDRRAFPTSNYSFIYKLKNSIEQIKGGIQKIKEQ